MDNAINIADLTPAREHLVSLMRDGKSLYDASIEAFPDKEKPWEYARYFLQDSEFGRILAFDRMQEIGLSIPEMVDKFKMAFSLAETSPKNSSALLKCVEKGFDFYALMPKEDKQNLTLNGDFITNINSTEVKNQVISEYYEDAKKELPENEIVTLIESGTIGEVEVLAKVELFDDGA